MNNREIFEVAEIEVIAFDAEDIIRTSGPEGGEGNIMPGDPINMFGHFVRP
jgi:hypothetical protein